MISVNFSQRISLAVWATALCLLVGAVGIWIGVHPAPPAPSSPPGSDSEPERSPRQGVRLRQVSPNKDETDTPEDALEPEEGRNRGEGVSLGEASSYPGHSQRRKDQTEPDRPTQFHSKTKGVNLRQVYPCPDDKTATDVDIIAIHGLDTQSPDTWIWDPKGARVNWLEDPHMLPRRFSTARIFTCDWPAALFEQPGFVQKMIDEFARLLLAGIEGRPTATNDQPGRDRPIVFVASCLGGIILAKALVMASGEYESVKRATRGIVFLATPFQGTSFQNVATWAEPALKLWASIRDKNVSHLLKLTKSTFDLDELVRNFTTLCLDNDLKGGLFTFYETGKSSLPRKIAPWLPAFLSQEQPLVDSQSATLHIVPHPLPINRPHVTVNKFYGPDDPGYVSVTGVLDVLLCNIRNGRPIEKADLWIRKICYSPATLNIERLSGDLLPMDQCYINLAIVERTSGNADRSKQESEGKDGAPQSSPFSLAARLNVETPDKNIQVELRSLFDERKDSDGKTMQPRRVLIRGRAGVGKTTLCKKMVHGFTTDEFRDWNKLFDRVLWVPLRKLKAWSPTSYNLEDLFCYEFFNQHPDRIILAQELFRTVHSHGQKTLFILDGLDEISQLLDDENPKFSFLQHLLNQPNVIITSRPHVSLPVEVRLTDLELETVGFYPDQVNDYLQVTFKADPRNVEAQSYLEAHRKVKEVQSYLEAHQLIQGLVRIPIQLDALCYTWDSFGDKPKPQTMTAMYKAIEENLWKKDIARLEKRTQKQMRIAHRSEINKSAKDEVYLLETLAFAGMQNDIIDFEPRHRNIIWEHLDSAGTDLLFDEILGRLSFLRTSDPSSKDRDRNYHFLHLTFQEYFAARYFVRQQKAQQPLRCLRLSDGDCSNIETAAFLQDHKYGPHYDIFWRFVAGLLDADDMVLDVDNMALDFFKAIEEEPRDLLGPTHQRLIMHCLSEVEQKRPTFTKLRTKLETRLEKWVLFECNFIGRSELSREMECPEQILVNSLKQTSEDALTLLESLSRRTTVPSSIIDVVSSRLNNSTSTRQCIAVLVLLRRQRKGLPETTLQGIAARFEDQDRDVRRAAIEALQGQADLPKGILQRITARLEDQDRGVRRAAINTLQGRADLPKGIVQGIATRLEHQDRDIREAAIEALQGRADLPEGILQRITARLEDQDWYVREAAINALQGRADLPKGILQRITARLEDQDRGVRRAAINTLQGQADLPKGILQRITARLEDQDRGVRRAAINTLQGRADLPKGIVQGIATRLEHQDRDIREAAIEALQGRADLPEGILQRITARLEDQDRSVRRAAINTLQGQADLPKGILQRIAVRLEDQDWYVREVTINALQGRADLPEGILQRITVRLEDQDKGVRRAAINTLQGRADLPKGIVQGIATRLEHQDRDIREAAIEALQGRADLPKGILQRIATRLEHQDRDIRKAVINALQGRADLPKGILQRIAVRLEDQDAVVQWAAFAALQGRADLSKGMLQGIAARLEHQDKNVRRAAIWALQGQADLPEGILQGIAAQLEDQDWEIEQAVIAALLNQGALSLTVLGSYVKPFYKTLLERSFREPLYWCGSENGFLAVGPKHISLIGGQHSWKETVVKSLLEKPGKGSANVANDEDWPPWPHSAAGRWEDAVVELLQPAL
ncbi:hypothetical protein B0T18DRAFT_37303 [Schizothecium vesticola]|uniref:NACHT domain-containing protein n=1 Tax=Schizothecium vesticola TaxID=314040 RepID=A0AA40KD32_9PEZI|nr:hypothetical protein B0T18DRAFT_37303 [Schizothecium vesticola]